MLPKQRLPLKLKTEDDFKWAKDCVKYFRTVAYTHSWRDKLANYKLYNNELDQEDFNKDCNPLGIDVGQIKDLILPYNKTYNKIQVLLGEELGKKFPFRATLTNPEGIRLKVKEIESRLSQTIMQYSMEGKNDSEIQAALNRPYLSSKEIMVNKLLKYYYKKLKIRDKKNETFKHALIADEEVVWVGEVNNQPQVIPINPINFFYHKSPEVKFIENSSFAFYVRRLTPADVLDMYGDDLDPKDIETIESRFLHSPSSHVPNHEMRYHHKDYVDTFHDTHNSADILVFTYEWRSEKKVGVLRYINEYGEEEKDLVSEEFVIPKVAKTQKLYIDNKLRTCKTWDDVIYYEIWIPEVWEATQIDEDIFVNIRPKPNQVRNADNPYEVKLGFHGLVYNNTNAQSISLMGRMKPFQYLYLVVMHKIKKLISLDYPNATPIDTTMIDPEIGLEKTIYYLNEAGLDIYNSLHNAEEPGAHQRGKATSAINRSNMQNIMGYINLLNFIDQQISEVAGVSKQREGQTFVDETATNARMAVSQSALITNIYFHAHSTVWENILNSLLDLIAVKMRNKSFLKQFILDDLSVEVINADAELFSLDSYGVFISDSIQDEAIFQDFRNLAQSLIQNDKATLTDLMKLLRADSTEEIYQYVKNSELEAQARQQQAIQQQQQHEQQLQQQALQNQIILEDLKTKRELMKAEIIALGYSKDVNNNDIPDAVEIERFKNTQS